MDTSLLEELQNIVAANGDGITQKSTNRLMITAMIQIAQSINGVERLLTVKLEEMEARLIERADEERKVYATKDELSDLKDELTEKIEDSFAYRVGKFVEDKPKWAIGIIVIGIWIINTWLSTSLQQWVVYLLGLPPTLLK